MKNHLLLFLGACLSILLLCSWGSKNYSVSVSNGSVVVKMRCPTRGMAGIDRISYDDFTIEEVEKEDYDKIRKNRYNAN